MVILAFGGTLQLITAAKMCLRLCLEIIMMLLIVPTKGWFRPVIIVDYITGRVNQQNTDNSYFFKEVMS